jgi:hypothetical protein
MAANGAGPMPAISMMRNPARGPIVVTFPLLSARRPGKRRKINQDQRDLGSPVCAASKRFSMPAWLHAP